MMLEITPCGFFPFSVTENSYYPITSHHTSCFPDSVFLKVLFIPPFSLSSLLPPLYNLEKKRAYLGMY